MRYAHILKDNKACNYPQQAIWFDTETDFEHVDDETIYHKLRFGYACYMRRHRDGVWTDEEWLRFTTRDSFWRFVDSKAREKTKLYLFCHNTSFDLPVLDVFNEMGRIGYKLRTAIIDAPPTILRFRHGTKCVLILDTLNIWRMPLRILGSEIGLEKLEMPEDNDLGVTWDTYGKRDVEIIRDACIRWWDFLESEDMGSFAPTLAGQAMRVYRHKYMSHQILLDSNVNALRLTREGYYGARCECFRIGKFSGEFHLLDVNSMYPFCMANKEFPRRLVSYTRYATMEDLHIWLARYSVAARVLLRTAIPFACCRRENKLVFPIGEFDCVLSTPEIQFALQHAEILEIKEVAVYEKAFLFTRMMHDMYLKRIQARDKGEKVRAFMYRKLINSFYGKWGQSGGIWKDDDNSTDLSCKQWMELDYETGHVIHHRQLGGLKQHKDTETEAADSFPAIAAHVTAFARMYLWELINLAGQENVYYCDTDSVLVNAEGRKRLEYKIDKQALGMLSVKGEYPAIEIWGCKDYRFGDKSRTKGVRKDALWWDDHTVYQEKWSGLRGLIASGIVDKPLTKMIRKDLNRLYNKGEILADGRVQPLLLFGE
jgi:hypothetical protein